MHRPRTNPVSHAVPKMTSQRPARAAARPARRRGSRRARRARRGRRRVRQRRRRRRRRHVLRPRGTGRRRRRPPAAGGAAPRAGPRAPRAHVAVLGALTAHASGSGADVVHLSRRAAVARRRDGRRIFGSVDAAHGVDKLPLVFPAQRRTSPRACRAQLPQLRRRQGARHPAPHLAPQARAGMPSACLDHGHAPFAVVHHFFATTAGRSST